MIQKEYITKYKAILPLFLYIIFYVGTSLLMLGSLLLIVYTLYENFILFIKNKLILILLLSIYLKFLLCIVIMILDILDTLLKDPFSNKQNTQQAWMACIPKKKVYVLIDLFQLILSAITVIILIFIDIY